MQVQGPPSPATAKAEYLFSLIIFAISALCAIGVLKMTGMVVPLRWIAPIIGFPAFFFGLHIVYLKFRPVLRLNLLAGSLGLLLASSLASAILAHTGMRLQMPLQDDALSGADRWMGIDTPGLVVMFAKHPVITQQLGSIYSTAVPAVFIVAIALSLTGKEQRVWELVFSYAAGLFVCCLISVIAPATANFVHAGFSAQDVIGLPSGSGIFHMGTVQYFRDGTNMVVDLNKFSGVVTFPSFHTMMALIVAYACRGNWASSAAASIWAVLVIISTIPIGGHYVIDLIGGATLWASIVLFVSIIRKRSDRPAAGVALAQFN